jgi:hypothetical protein
VNFILKTVSFIVCLISIQTALAAEVRIWGKAPEYANNTIELFTCHDFISEETIKLRDLRFNSAGNFELVCNLSEISFAFAEFDGYRGIIYLEPGKTYQLLFPPKRALTETQKRNPFTKPEPVWLGIANPSNNELNVLIQKFEQAYAKYENEFFNEIFINQSATLVDTVKQKLAREFPKTSDQFFEHHKTFRLANLEFALHQGKSATFTGNYFSKTKPVYNLEAYAIIFNQVFLNYFNVLETSAQHSGIKSMINSARLAELDQYFQNKLNFNKELSHWILLKSIKDAYYSKNYNKASLLKLLEQVKSQGWSAYEQKTAELIREKLTYLASGTDAPGISLINMEGQTVRFSDYKNTYLYLHFTDPKNPVCRQHLDALKKTSAIFRDKLIIINVIPEKAGFTNASVWPGIFTTTISNIKEIYKVKTFPNSFLLGKDGKLLLSPAPNPIDGFDRLFGQILKSEHLKEMQKQNNPKAK